MTTCKRVEGTYTGVGFGGVGAALVVAFAAAFFGAAFADDALEAAVAAADLAEGVRGRVVRPGAMIEQSEKKEVVVVSGGERDDGRWEVECECDEL